MGRRIKKRKIPVFRRQGSHVKVRAENRWRKPRGDYSKQARYERSRGKRPTVGYGQPKEFRNIHPCGLYEVRVCNIADLEKINAKTHAARISAAVGSRKRADIKKRADELKIKLLNYKEVHKKITKKKEEKKTESPKIEKKTEVTKSVVAKPEIKMKG
ncbi:MAG: 50S ribosomal protein L32e [Candidatus Micrarchaeota archaeon]